MRGPERRCIATGTAGPKTQLIRFVVGPGDALVPDIRGKLPGRGIWVSARREAVEIALKKRLFQRAAHAQLQISPVLCEEIEALLARQVQNALGLAHKTGAVAAGFAKAEALMAKGRAIALMEARNAGVHGAAKLGARAAAQGIPVIAVLTAEEMGLALGRENMVHAALGAERLARRVLEETRRLSGFRLEPAGDLPSSLPECKVPAPESEESR